MEGLTGLAYVLGMLLGIGVMAALFTGIIYLISRIFGRRLTRREVRGVFIASCVICAILSIIGRFA